LSTASVVPEKFAEFVIKSVFSLIWLYCLPVSVDLPHSLLVITCNVVGYVVFFGSPCARSGYESGAREACASDPCKNGGTCITTRDGGFVCKCRDKFQGDFCTIGKTKTISHNSCITAQSNLRVSLPVYHDEALQMDSFPPTVTVTSHLFHTLLRRY